MSKIQEIAAAVASGRIKLISALVEEALAEGQDPLKILNAGMIRAMEEIGEKFRRNEVFVPEILAAARAMKKGMEGLEPHLVKGSMTAGGTFIVGTVKGDLHDIGKNMVAMLVGSAGFAVIDLGVDVPAERYIEAVRENQGGNIVVGLSSLLTTTMPAMKETVAALKGAGFANRVRILVGGAPITAEFALEIGADAYSPDAASAVQTVRMLLS